MRDLDNMKGYAIVGKLIMGLFRKED